MAALALLLAGCASGGGAPETAAGEEPGNNAQESTEIAATPEQIPVQATSEIVLPDLGPAPAWSNATWINSERPLLLPDLRGKVVLLEFWTYGWINCRRVIPWVREWHDTYAGDDFVVIGMHYPEFSHEEVFENVVRATVELGVEYPVALDNEGKTWRAYGQRYWPTRYLIDKNGRMRYKHIGEGAYDETEAFIQLLMAEADPPAS